MRASFSIAILFTSLAIIFTGCKRDEVKVYRVENENSSAPAPQTEMSAPAQGENPQPQLKFVLPENWTEIAPSQMRAASFLVTNASGQSADVGVIPLPVEGQEIQIVNMWRQQMQLPDLTNETAAAATVAVGNATGKLFEIASVAPLIDGKFRARILVAELPRAGMSWFFKMTGEDAFVASQKENFLQFLKSVSFVAPDMKPLPPGHPEVSGMNLGSQNQLTPDASTTVGGGDDGQSIWKVPANWKSLPASQFLLAEFSIAGTSGQSADVNVAELNGTGGGLLANANRWRRQLGLPEVSESDLATLTTAQDSSNGKMQIVDFTGTNANTGKAARLIGVVVPQNGETWFYKLMGDETVVAQQKDAFLKIIQSANYSNARSAP